MGVSRAAKDESFQTMDGFKRGNEHVGRLDLIQIYPKNPYSAGRDCTTKA